jgi:Tfp pilus assembly protein PilF
MSCKMIPCVLGFVLLFVAGCASKPEADPGLAGELEIARQYNESGQYRRAVAALHELRRKQPQNATVEAYLGFAYMGLNNFKAASNSYERALQLEPKNDDVRMNFAYALIVQKRFMDARVQLKKIEEGGIYPYMEKVYVNDGLSYMEEKRCDLAHPRFDAAIKRDPVMTSAHFNKGRCYMTQQNYPKAVQSFLLAVDACQGCIDPYLELTKAYFKNGQPKIAREKLQAILMKGPDAATEARVKQILQEHSK